MGVCVCVCKEREREEERERRDVMKSATREKTKCLRKKEWFKSEFRGLLPASSPSATAALRIWLYLTQKSYKGVTSLKMIVICVQ